MTQFENKLPDESVNAPDNSIFKQVIGLLSTIGIIIVIVTLITQLFASFIGPNIPTSIHKKISSFYLKQFLSGDVISIENIKEKEQYVQKIFSKILDSLEIENQDDWEIKYLATPIPAATLPGKTVFVSDELFKYICTENALSFVLAHEIGHAYLSHPERGIGKIIPQLAFGLLLGSANEAKVLGGLNNLTQLKLSRDDETSSDNFAKDVMIKLYGHLGGASEFFDNIKERDEDHGPSFHWLSTHPDTEARISNLKPKNENGKIYFLPKKVSNETFCTLN